MNSKEIQNGIHQIYKNDTQLATIIDAAGEYTLKPRNDHYLSLIRAIINQQLSNKVAAVILKRFINYFDGKPTKEAVLAAPDDVLRSLGLSWAKVKYVKDLSFKILNKELSFFGINKKNDGEVIADLTKVKGIGVWSAQIFLIFNLGRLDILPNKDVALLRAAKNIYNLRKMPDQKKLVSISRKYKWEPYKSIACWYLWRSLEL